ncbi:MAG: hypothetical protein FJW39_11155 [Acidobacteria bacterium]|nr:hypothetical protein [Acidobacteriota bacterium]
MNPALGAFLLFLGAASAWAQSSNSFGYVFGGVTYVPASGFTRWDGSFVSIGGGGEAAIGRYVTAGGEAVVLAPASNRFARTSGMATGGVSVFPVRSRKAEPFFSGGAGALVSGDGALVGYAGGGVHYWFQARVGMRLEYRHHFTDRSIQLVGFRAGLVFR